MADYKVKVKDCDAEQCGYRCQEACPQGVFLAVPRDRKMERHAANPRYRIVPRFVYFCDGCGECLPACPRDAIRVFSRKTGEEIRHPVAPG
jgi:NAD-dependent dihydropyrimidine dehydrogenase PreA subunit